MDGDTDEFPVETLLTPEESPLNQAEEIVFWQGFDVGNDRMVSWSERNNRYRDIRLYNAYEFGFRAGGLYRRGQEWEFPTSL